MSGVIAVATSGKQCEDQDIDPLVGLIKWISSRSVPGSGIQSIDCPN
jgi:hypothetical protein